MLHMHTVRVDHTAIILYDAGLIKSTTIKKMLWLMGEYNNDPKIVPRFACVIIKTI